MFYCQTRHHFKANQVRMDKVGAFKRSLRYKELKSCLLKATKMELTEADMRGQVITSWTVVE